MTRYQIKLKPELHQFFHEIGRPVNKSAARAARQLLIAIYCNRENTEIKKLLAAIK